MTLTIEHDKLDVLFTTYIKIIRSEGFDYIKDKMADNHEFLSMLMKQKAYIDMSEKNRMYLAKIPQSVDCLENITNYEVGFILNYLRNISGFDSRESAEKFISLASGNSEVAADNDIYENIHERLIDGGLKRKYTIIHKKAM